jgi:hypothetical protein
MTRYTATITYNTAVNSRSPSAYAVQIEATDAPLSALHSVPPVVNNRAVTRGVFASRMAAADAVSGYIATPHALAAYTDALSGECRIRVEPHSIYPTTSLGMTRRVLSSVTASGKFVSA